MTAHDLVVRDVGCRLHSGRTILREISATFPAGAITAVIGENGSGKSTLARILAGVDPPGGGSVERPAGRAHLVPERAPALAGCSAQTLARAFALRSVDRRMLDSRLAESLVALGFSHDASAPLGRLSKGNLQKAHLAVTYAISPGLAIVDEPATGLDARARKGASRLLRDLADAGAVVILTAHTPVADVDRSFELVAGRLVPMAVSARRHRAYVFELRGGDAPRAAVRAMKLGAVIDDQAGDALRVRVAEPDLGAFLVAAVDLGLQVVGVTPEAGRMKIVALLGRMKVAQRRGLAAWVIYLAFVAALYAVPGPLVQAYAVTSAVLLVATCWLVFGTIVTERSATTLLAAAAGGSARFHAMQVAAGAMAAAPLGVIAIAWGLVVAWPAKHPGQVIVVGLLAHVLAILVGAGIGAIAGRPVLADGALSLSAAIGLLIIVLAIPASSPYGPSLRHLSHGDGDVPVLLLSVAGGVIWVAVLTVVGGVVAARRRSYGMAAPDA